MSESFRALAQEGAATGPAGWRDTQSIAIEVEEDYCQLMAEWYVDHGAQGQTLHRLTIFPAQIPDLMRAAARLLEVAKEQREAAILEEEDAA